jgi:hypothetical protein
MHDRAEIEAFLASYRAAFERFDSGAIAEHFAYPTHVTGDRGEVVLVVAASKTEWAQQLDGLLGMYRRMGMRSARSLEITVTELSPRLVVAHVRWALFGERDAPIYEFDALYTLGRLAAGWRITAIANNEMLRLRR